MYEQIKETVLTTVRAAPGIKLRQLSASVAKQLGHPAPLWSHHIDRALQAHRKAGRIEYSNGWHPVEG